MDHYALLNTLKGLDIVTEEQILLPRIEQWLKRLFILLSHPTEISVQNISSNRGVSLSSVLDFSKATILGPSADVSSKGVIPNRALTVDMLAADEERSLASHLHDLYAINTLNRKVRLQDARRKVTTVRRKEQIAQKVTNSIYCCYFYVILIEMIPATQIIETSNAA